MLSKIAIILFIDIIIRAMLVPAKGRRADLEGRTK
jgi:hypothetical protein